VSSDTPKSVIDKSWAEKNGLKVVKAGKGVGAGGEVLTFKTKIKELRIGELKIKNFEVLAIDLSHISSKFGVDISGAIRNDILRKFKAIIDYNEKILKLRLQ